MLGLTVPKIENVRVAFVGLGMRGPGAVNRFTHIPGVEVVALCDFDSVRAEKCQKYLRDAGLAPANIYFGEDGYKAICERPDVDLVYVATDWDHHFPVAKYALENGKNTAIEVPSRYEPRTVLGAYQPLREKPQALHDSRKLLL